MELNGFVKVVITTVNELSTQDVRNAINEIIELKETGMLRHEGVISDAADVICQATQVDKYTVIDKYTVTKFVIDRITANVLREVAERQVPDPAVEVIKYVVLNRVEEPIELLTCWLHGEFDEIRRDWDNVPDTVFPSE